MNFDLYHGDCLEVMAGLPDASVDMILCDLPYGTTACKWDTVIPFEPLWAQYRRVAKRNAAIVLTASQPFTTALIASNMREFKYCWVWNKKIAANFASANRQPLRVTEDVVVFGGSAYCPQKVKGRLRMKGGGKQFVVIYGESDKVTQPYESDEYHPTNIIEITNAARASKVHPTQKPVALMEYLIRTYTQDGETVLDNCMGSGTTGVAAVRIGRRFIGIERERKYFDIACERIEREQQQARHNSNRDAR